MNLKHPKIQDLTALLASQDDNAGHHIIWADLNGEVHIECLTDLLPVQWHEKNEGKFKLRLETCECGNGYVGPEAAKDRAWVEQVFGQLNSGWNSPGNSHYIDY